MSNDRINARNKRIANITSLTMENSGIYGMSALAAKAVGRFAQTASLLPENDFLGWQITADKEKNLHVFAFSSEDAGMTPKDFEWIFQTSAIVKEEDTVSFSALHKDFRRVYALRHMPELSHEIQSFEKQHIFSDEPVSADYFRELVNVITEFRAVIRIMTETGTKGQSMILISLTEEMTLRMRTILSLAFPDTVVVDIAAAADIADFRLPTNYLLESMTGLLETLMLASSADKFAPDDIESEDDSDEGYYDDTDGFTSDSYQSTDDLTELHDEKESGKELDNLTLAELDLSVRSFCSLTRARINTVGELRQMSAEDLMKVRSFGRKCLEEIRSKLAVMGLTLLDETIPPSSSLMLHELIGLNDVKAQVEKITAFAKMKKDMETLGRTSAPVVLNMAFVGNPGTAKTTVARIMAGIFKEIGILSSSQIVEVGRADLVAGYIGQTATKVKEVFRRASGKLLFIDEAYSLVSNPRGDFGDEAINTIVQEMENHRSDTIVVFAGYPEEMESFLSRNPGLKSRVPFRIGFSDYSADEMIQIVKLEAEKRGFSISAQALEKAASLCETAKRHPDTGNGRFCRNLVENAILSYALRVYGKGTENAEKNFTLAEADFVLPDNMEAMPEAQKSSPIGFRY